MGYSGLCIKQMFLKSVSILGLGGVGDPAGPEEGLCPALRELTVVRAVMEEAQRVVSPVVVPDIGGGG